MSEKTEKKMGIYEKLMLIQNELNVPKNLFNSFGNFSYRNCEAILEAAKPVAAKYRCVITLNDDIVNEGDRYYVQAIATLTDVDTEKCIMASAFAREPDHKTKMDDAQVTGTSSSYARKYALGALLDLDDNKDADTNEYQEQTRVEPQEDNPKVSADNIEKLQLEANEAGITIDQICGTFQLATLQDMTKKQWVHAIKMLEAEKAKKGSVA